MPATSEGARRGWIALVLGLFLLGTAVMVTAVYLIAGRPFAIASAVFGVPAALTLAWARLRPDAGKRSMLRLMADHHDVGLQPTASGLEAIGIPFPHAILLLGKERFEYRAALEATATAAFNKRWANFTDPLVGLRARTFVSNRLGEDELMLFFGTGIFAPGANEQPVGRIEVRLADGVEGTQPCFPDRSPAGLYRGQSTLTFSLSTDTTPATIDGIPGASGVFCLRSNPGGAESGPYVLDWEPGPDVTMFRPAREFVEPPASADAMFRIIFPEVSFDVVVTDDTRPSRLLHAQPPGRSFAIVGVMEPTNDDRAPDRWWIDIDDNGHLIASGMRRPRRSLVCRGDALTVWDWSAAAASTAHAAKLQTLRDLENERRVLMAPPGRPFGWLAAPGRCRPAAYMPGQPGMYELDWLDFSGAVEDVFGRADRLGVWLHAHPAIGLFPGLNRGQGDEALLVAPPGETKFRAASHTDWSVGTRVICDVLVLEVVEGNAT
jgi:hypothetical protein